VHTTGGLLERFVQGENCVLFAYGMTASGKTYTVQGSNDNPGLFPRLVKDILTRMNSMDKSEEWELQVSMLEIYQENIYDLLGDKKEKLSIRDGNGKVEVRKLTSRAITKTTEAVTLLETAASKRYRTVRHRYRSALHEAPYEL
jgi:Kinesin motor domain